MRVVPLVVLAMLASTSVVASAAHADQASPRISQVSPAVGPQPGGGTVTITGTGLDGASTVLFGGVASPSISQVSPTEVTAAVPPGMGDVDVTVTTGSGTSASGPTDRFAYSPGSVAGFTPVAPVRVVDTRTPNGPPGPIGPGDSLYVDLDRELPVGATAALVTLTAVSPSAPTYLAPESPDSGATGSSALSAGKGETVATEVVLPLARDRSAEILNAAGSVQVLVDLLGYYADGVGSGHTALAPVRVLDTRSGTGAPRGRVGPGGRVSLDLSAEIPPDAVDVTLNATAVGPTAATFVTAFASGSARPATSNLDVGRGQTIASAVTVPVHDGAVTLYNDAGAVDLLADLTGYDAPDGDASQLTPVGPFRVYDDRPGAAAHASGTVRLASPSGTSLVPATARAAVVTITEVAHGGADFVSAASAGTTPSTSTVNVAPGQTRANLAIVPLTSLQGTPGFTIRKGTGTSYAIVDLVGYLQPDPVTVIPRPLAAATAGLDTRRTSWRRAARDRTAGRSPAARSPTGCRSTAPASSGARRRPALRLR